MASSLDGRILPERWSPRDAHSHEAYDRIHDRLGGGSWIVGRVTGQEFAKGELYPSQTDQSFPRETWLPQPDASTYAIVADAHGKIAWGRADIGGDPIVVLLTEHVSDAHLAGLRSDGVGYLFAGVDELIFEQAIATLGDQLGIDHLLLEGGGHINGTFLRAGLIDAISLMIVPAVDGSAGAPAVFDGPERPDADLLPLTRLTLEEQEILNGGIVWLRYRVHYPES
jgi:riboflavin biosynthesis pyrimidine reductase